MKHLKTYEFFNSWSKKSKTWQEKFGEIWDFYQKNKDKKVSVMDIPNAEVKENEFSISQDLDNNLVFYGQTGGRRNWVVLDFSEVDYGDPNSDKGVSNITPEEYEKYKKMTEEISDWLDERSEGSLGKTGTSVSDTGDINLDFDEGDLAIEEINDKVKSRLDIVGKEYEFEMSYHLWTSKSTNELVVERRELKITDMKFGFGGRRFFCELFTVDPFGEKASIWLDANSSHQYYDFEKHNWPYHGDKAKFLKMSSIQREMTRKEKREFEQNRKYPYSFMFEITPSEWDSMEVIKEITSILKELNSNIK